MRHLTKSVRLEVKATNDDEGTFKAYASTWTRQPDSYGDVVARGAFADTLKAWEQKSENIPVLWNHNDFDPKYYLGYVVNAEEDAHGLLIEGKLDLENDMARQTYRLLKHRTVTKMSFAYTIEDAEYVTEDGEEKYELRKLNIIEVSIVPYPANPDTSIESVKAGKGFTDKQIEALQRFADELNGQGSKEPDEGVSEENLAPSSGEAGSNALDADGETKTGKPGVSEETAARVLEKISQLIR